MAWTVRLGKAEPVTSDGHLAAITDPVLILFNTYLLAAICALCEGRGEIKLCHTIDFTCIITEYGDRKALDFLCKMR